MSPRLPAAAIVVLLVVVISSYRQICYAYPNGGAAYGVSADILGRTLHGEVRSRAVRRCRPAADPDEPARSPDADHHEGSPRTSPARPSRPVSSRRPPFGSCAGTPNLLSRGV